tara:strand:+ start:130 stop:450 length:321 start_codon:yes stop_codon:yes gene_type:complete
MSNISRLTLNQIDYLCGKIQGREYEHTYHPTTNDTQAFELLELFGIEYTKNFEGYRGRQYSTDLNPFAGISGKVVAGIKDLKVFICTLVVASHYGDDIDPKLLESE